MTTAPETAVIPPTLVVTAWYGDPSNGVAMVAESVVHSIRAAGGRAAVLRVVGDGWLPRARKGPSGETILTVCIRDPKAAKSRWRRAVARIRLAVVATAVRRIVRHERLRIAHFHFAFPEYGPLVDVVRRVGLVPVATFHGSDLVVNMGDPRTRAATEHLLRMSGAATAVSNAQRLRLEHYFPFVARRATTVYNAVPERFLQLALTAPARDRDIDVLFVGNLVHRKGVDVLLRALSRVLARRSMTRLTIAGDGVERAALEKLASELGVASRVEFLGRRTSEELVELYSRARVLAVPSRHEAFGLVVVEASACGAAVVGTKVGGIPEIISPGETGMLVAPNDPDALATALLAVLDDERYRNAIAMAGRRRALARFTPDAILREYAAVFRRALADATTAVDVRGDGG